jgi:glutathionyl-hydroquinone reductase
MGAPTDGLWTTDLDETKDGACEGKPTSFRRRISYESGSELACPWARWTLMVRKPKRLESRASSPSPLSA